MTQIPKVFGLETDHARWLTLALEGASHAHWPRGIPPIISEQLSAIRESAERFHSDVSELTAILLVSEAEGVEGETEIIEVDSEEIGDEQDTFLSDLEVDEDDDEEDDAADGDEDSWKDA